MVNTLECLFVIAFFLHCSHLYVGWVQSTSAISEMNCALVARSGNSLHGFLVWRRGLEGQCLVRTTWYATLKDMVLGVALQGQVSLVSIFSFQSSSGLILLSVNVLIHSGWLAWLVLPILNILWNKGRVVLLYAPACRLPCNMSPMVWLALLGTGEKKISVTFKE